MSNHWDLRCTTCDVDCDLDWNHGGQAIQELIPLLPSLRAARSALRIVDDHAYATQLPWGVIDFADRHYDHDLIAVDEYGSLFGECARRYSCPCCRHGQTCTKPRDHEGDCGPLPEDGAA